MIAAVFVWSLWPWILAAAVALGFAVLINEANDIAAGAVGIIALVVLILLVVIGIATPRMQAYDHRQCDRWGESHAREVRWIRYSSWTSTCVTPTDDGRWIDVDSVIEVGGKITTR